MSAVSSKSLPEGWVTIPVGDLGRWVGGGTPSKANLSFWVNGTIPWISPKDMKSSRITETEDLITPLAVESSATSLLDEDSVVIVTRSGILRRTFPVAVTAVPATLNQDLKGLTPHPGIDATYVHYALRAFEQEILDKCVKDGTTVQSVDFPKFLQFTIPLAPLAEQHRIVAEIETQLTRLDASVAALKRAQANLKRYRAAVLKAACEGRLVPTEAELEDTETRHSEADRANGTPCEANVSGGPIPKGWHMSTWSRLAKRVTVGHVGPMKHKYVPSGIPFLRSQNVRENRFDPSGLLFIPPEFHTELSKSTLRPGDLVVVRSGSVGVTCVIPEALPEANCADLVIIQQPQGILPQFGSFYMNSLARRIVREGQVGVALIHFNTKSVAEMPVPVPPLAEQHRIVEEVERRLSVVEEMEKTVAHGLKRAERLRQAILRKAFAGELVPQDPADEPASVLLERIRAERAATAATGRRRKSIVKIG